MQLSPQATPMAATFRAGAARADRDKSAGGVGEVVEVRVPGPGAFTDLTAAIERVATTMLDRPASTALVDLRETDFVPTMVQAELLLDMLVHRSQVIRNRVAVVARPGAQFGMLRLVTIKASLRDLPIAAFTFEGEARRFLETGLE